MKKTEGLFFIIWASIICIVLVGCSSTEDDTASHLNTQVEITVINKAQELQSEIKVYMFWFFSFEETSFFAKKEVKTDTNGLAKFNISSEEFALESSQTEAILKFIVFTEKKDEPITQKGNINLVLKKGETKKGTITLND